MSRMSPHKSPARDPKPKPKPLEQAEADFTAEGSPPPGKVGKRPPAVAATPVTTTGSEKRNAELRPSPADPERSGERSS